MSALLLAALLLVDDGPAVAREASFVPFAIDWSRTPDAVVDLSTHLDEPAGAGGPVRPDGERLVDGHGERFRIWGVNLVGEQTFPTHADAVRIADDLQQMGINAVRMHQLDVKWYGGGIFGSGDSTESLDPENLDRLDYLIAELKKRGIYTNLNLNVFREYRPKDAVRDAATLGYGKGATYFNRRLIELQKQYARQLLTHTNAYTGIEYRREPAIITVELLNENSLVEAWLMGRLEGDAPKYPSTWSALPVSYQLELTVLFNDWLRQNRPDRLETWKHQAGLAADQPLPRTLKSELTTRDPAIVQAEAAFYQSVERDFYAEMKTLLKDELGTTAMLVGDADHNDSIFGYPHIDANATFDLLDGHGYWQHPQIGEQTVFNNVPMVNDVWDNTVVQFARTPIVGKPYVISETNHPFPHESAAEGFPILTAYAMLHDWDGIYWFSYRGGPTLNPSADGMPKNGWFSVDQDPIKRSILTACGQMWHARSVRSSPSIVVRNLPRSRLVEQFGPTVWNGRPYFDEDFDVRQSLISRTRFRFGSATADYPQIDDGPLTSETGELVWDATDQGRGRVTINTEQAVGFIGHRTDGPLELGPVRVQLESDFATVMLVSLDGQAIDDSKRLFLSACDAMQNTGQVQEPAGDNPLRLVLTEWGTGPTRIRPVRGEIVVTGRTGSAVVAPLDASLNPIPESARRSHVNESLQIPLGDPATCSYLIEFP